jgi:GT2 family glycosyltransferase
MIDLSIIIVSYNTKGVLKECVESIFRTVGDLSFEIIIVDNASTDGTDKELRIKNSELRIPNLIYIQNKTNLGFSKANNIGVKKSKGKFVLFLNPDIVVYENTLRGMVNFMESQSKVGAATCKLVLPNGKIDDASHRGFPTPWNSFAHFSGLSKLFGKTRVFGGYNLGFMNLSVAHEIDALAGAFMIVRREAGEKVNWWDEDYFFYGEDIDFCYMLKQQGWQIYYIPQFSVLHYKGVAGGIKNVSKHITTANKETKSRATKARFNAMRIFYKKHYEGMYPWIITRLVYLGISLKQLFS